MNSIIEPEKDNVILDGKGIEIDCKELRDQDIQIVIYENSDKWVEKIPFNGRETDFDFTISDKIIEEAEKKLPKTVYNNETGEDKIIAQGDEIPEGYSETKSEEVKLKQAKSDKISEIERTYSRTMEFLIGNYPEEERNGWAKQEEHALKYKNGEDSLLISKMAEIRELSEDEMADRILAKVAKYEEVYSELTATLHVLQEKIEKAETNEQVDQVNWPENY